jgi:mannose-6-phosphate isomerase-like protein (cupin superfamily)
MKAHDLRQALAPISAGAVRTAEEDAAAFPRLASFNDGAIYVGRFAGQTPWERHPDRDELLHVLDGAVDITLLTPDGPAEVSVAAGSVFVVPRGLWHRQLARGGVTLLAAVPDNSEISEAEDPRGSEVP